jgi:hypothetical protein
MTLKAIGAAWLVTCAVAVLSPRASLAGSSAHGGDQALDQGNPWFLGEEPVPYCTVIEDKLNEAAVRGLIREALAQWRPPPGRRRRWDDASGQSRAQEDWRGLAHSRDQSVLS